MTKTERRRPPLAVLVGLCVLAIVPPALSYAGVSDVGAFRMFTRPFEQRIVLTAVREDGTSRVVPLLELDAHLSRDDRRVLRPGATWAPGETAASLLDAHGARDLAELVCAIEHDAARVRVDVDRRSLPARRPLPGVHAELRCPR